MHEGPGGGHFGVGRVQHKLCAQYYWKSMCEDVKYFIKMCKTSQKRKGTKLLKPKLKLNPIPIPSKIFTQVGMDLIHIKGILGI